MANEKFSEFTVQTDLSNFTGLVGFQTNTANYYITKSNFYNDLEANLDLTDFTTITGGAAGEVLTIDGAGTGLTWSTISVATPDIADVLTEGDTTSAGQKIEITPSAGTGTMKFWQYGIADSVTGGGNLDITKSTAGNIVVAAFGGNLILQSAAASTIQCNSDLNLQTNDLLDSTGGTGTAGQVLSSLGNGRGS